LRSGLAGNLENLEEKILFCSLQECITFTVCLIYGVNVKVQARYNRDGIGRIGRKKKIK
jgi:hypothetical protein